METLEKRTKKFVAMAKKNELKEYAYNWVLFQYELEELKDFINKIRETEILEEDIESENGLFSGAKGNNTLELEEDLKYYFLEKYF